MTTSGHLPHGPPNELDEVVSPELALVDPELAARARAALDAPRAPAVAVTTVARSVSETHQKPPPEPSPREDPPPRATPSLAELQQATEGAGRSEPVRRPRRRRALVLLTAFVALAAVTGYLGAQWQADRDDRVATGAAVALEPDAVDAAPQAPSSGTSNSSAFVPTSRVFAWPPVGNAIAYRVEFFRGGEQILAVRTTSPRVEVPARWRHVGKQQQLSPGVYRWYVWPVFRGRGAKESAAIVQASLEIDAQAARQRPGGAADAQDPSIT